VQKETSALVAELVDLQRASAAAAAKESSHMMAPSDVDTDTDEDDEAAYTAWTRRELARIKREEAMRDPAAARAEEDAAAEAFARPAVRASPRLATLAWRTCALPRQSCLPHIMRSNQELAQYLVTQQCRKLRTVV
jgi:Microfibril-associated/Pre-mRNA processing